MADITGDNSSETIPGTASPDTIQGLGGTDVITGLDGTDTISGGDGADDIDGGDGNDTIYGHSVADLDPNSGVIQATPLADVGAGAVFVTGAPGDDGHVYALAKDTGVITRIDTATGAATTFLDIPDTEFVDGGEQGVLGLAFHPDYDTNGRFFVYLTNEAGDCEIREYQRQPGDPPTADPVYVQTIITIPHPSNTNHNGGSICFGPDGNLYVSVGDGGGSNDSSNNAQNLDVLLGKILRIDVDSDDFAGDPERNYAIPADNPFAGAVEGADEIWDYGLRNPWRISFDPLTGDLYIGDVGQGAREEVDFEPAGSDGGVNYGWKLREGFIEGPGWPPPGPVDLTDPIDDYDRTVGRSITGGYVYRGPASGLEGAYFYADFVSDRLFTLRVVDGVAEDVIDRTDQIVGADLSSISSFGTDNAGNLYAVTIDGGIYRLDPSVAAGDGADTIAGAAGNDEIYGGAGNDRLDGGADNDTLAGGNGIDTASYAGAVAGVTVALSVAGAQNTGGDGTDTLTSMENLIGSGFADTLSGTAGENAVSGGGGADNVKGYAGNDILNGEAGDDTLNGGATNDTLNGGDDNDTLIGQDGNDTLAGGAGTDTASYVGAVAGVTVALSVAGAQNTGGDGIDTLTGIENLIGSGTGDTLSGTSGINALTGNGGDDSLTGYAGDDTLNGDKGNDTLNGGANNDTLNGGDNNDTLIGQDGNDTLSGGVGIDTASYVGAVASVTVALSMAGAQNTGGDGTDTLSSIEKLIGSGFADTLGGTSWDNTISGGGGADNVKGYAGNDILNGDTGDDTLNGGANNDTLNGGENNDTLIGQDGNDTLAGGNGIDTASYVGAVAGVTVSLATTTAQNTVGDGTDTLSSIENVIGSGFGDTLNGSGGDNALSGGNNNDTLMGFSGLDVLSGDKGNDLLNGGANNDTLNGGANDDDLIGQDGDDSLSGGSGADEFIVQNNHGADTVTDFQNGTDTVRLVGVTGVNDFGDLTLTDTGPGVLVDYGNGTILLATVSDINTIDAGDFSFA